MALWTLEAPRDLLSRILETPDLARVVQSLEPAVLNQLVCLIVPKRDDGPAARRRLRVTTEFEFVSENRQIAWVRDFTESLPGRLAG